MLEDIALLMEEPPGGLNHGRRATADGHEELGSGETTEFMREGGWSVVDIQNNKDEAGGLTSHRGILHPDEHVDVDVLRTKVERGLGFTYEQIGSVYRSGPLSDSQRQIRASIDARLLALSRSGGNMLELSKALGWGIEPASEGGGQRCKTMERAIARARQAELES